VTTDTPGPAPTACTLPNASATAVRRTAVAQTILCLMIALDHPALVGLIIGEFLNQV
jgi:hypothetical protein